MAQIGKHQLGQKHKQRNIQLVRNRPNNENSSEGTSIIKTIAQTFEKCVFLLTAFPLPSCYIRLSPNDKCKPVPCFNCSSIDQSHVLTVLLGMHFGCTWHFYDKSILSVVVALTYQHSVLTARFGLWSAEH